nr:uncharacterized protein LOC103347851 isoform X1 [Oryctolagus cuniculus]
MKRKQKTKHLEITYSPQAAKISRGNLNLYKDVLQQKQKAPTPASDQKAGDAASSSSHYFSCISSEDKLNGAGVSTAQTRPPQAGYSLEEKILVHEARETSSQSEYHTCQSTLHKHPHAGKGKAGPPRPGRSVQGEGIEAFHKCAPQPEYSLEDKTLVHKAKDIASESEYYTCHSTLSMPTRAGKG